MTVVGQPVKGGRILAKVHDVLVARTATRPELRSRAVAKLETEVRHRGDTASDALLCIFDVLDEWIERDTAETRTLVKAVRDMSRAEDHRPLNDLVVALAGEARLQNVDDFVLSWHVLLDGAITQSATDRGVVQRAKSMATHLLDHHRIFSRGNYGLEWSEFDELHFGSDTPEVATLVASYGFASEWSDDFEDFNPRF